MSKIKQLPLHEAQKIAAGEVVERPANVVKELVENAIDAGATNIAVHLEDGGKQLIRIVDNGCGMSPEDAHLCFGQHATSKITTVDDLGKIGTFGFRGEALASIAAVSQVTLITREQNANTNDLSGTKLELKTGEVVGQEVVSCTPGTDITVKQLFYNVPARQKFLKKKETESRQIIQLLHAFCLDYLNIHFTFSQHEREIINCPPTTDTISRITQLWDHTFAGHMIPIEAEKNGIIISGAISNHQQFRYDRNTIFFFVNKRWIKDQHLSRALLRGYSNVLPPSRYPVACIFVHVDPTQVDINIHPRKEEVQFLHPRTIATLLQNEVKSALENHLSSQIRQPIQFRQERHEQAPTHFAQPQQFQPFDFGAVPEPFDASSPRAETNASPVLTPVAPQAKPDEHHEQATIIDASKEKQKTEQKDFQLIGQYNKTYLLIERSDGLFLVDQHAAHERILYELFSKRFEDVATVKLMFPQIISVSAEDMSTLTPHLNIFKRNGIEVEPFGDTQLIVQSTPVHIKTIKLDQLARQVAAWIREHEGLDEQKFFKAINEKMHAQMACKAAVKAGDVLTREQMMQLLDDLATTDNRLTCPHGRPTGWLLSLYDIEKKFKRKI